jgi:hypothetical protein
MLPNRTTSRGTHPPPANDQALAGGAPGSRFEDVLEAAARCIDGGDETGARSVLRALPPLDLNHTPENLKRFLFLKAIWRRLDEPLDHRGNLYLARFAFRQINLFNLMAERLPLVRRAGEMINRLLLGEVLQSERPVLVDIGIGTGRQEVALLELLASSGAPCGPLTIVGIEPSAESLRGAAAAVLGAARRLGLDVTFHCVAGCVEELSAAEWDAVTRLARGGIVCESFALHHVAAGPIEGDPKDAVLRRIRALEPSLLAMVEPDSDHHDVSLAARVRNAWRHFGLVFEVVDRIDASPEERDAIKVLFFSREIDDIIASPEHERSERHERGAMWVARALRAGFRLRSDLSAFEDPPGDLVRFAWKGDHLGLDVRSETVVSLIAAGV